MLCLLAFALVAAGCGKKGDPLPPVLVIPAAIQELTVHQQGWDFLVEMEYPKLSIAGAALGELDNVEILQLSRPAPPDGAAATVDARLFEGAAETALELRGGGLASATAGNRIFLRLAVPRPLPDPPVAYSFAARSTASAGEPSGLSNLVTLAPAAPPEPPSSLSLIPSADGIRVLWQAPITDEVSYEGYNVYRRDARNRSYRKPLRFLEIGERAEAGFLDEGARFDNRYIYTVTTVTRREPLVESRLSGEAEVFYQDRFPPSPPGGLVALAEVGQVRLRWDRAPGRDTAGYHVYRSDGGDFRRLTREAVSDREYLDSDARSGRRYSYRITAVDGSGNEGDPGDEVATTVR